MAKISQKRNGVSKLIILAMVLLLPGFLYIMVNRMGSNEYVKLPVYGEKSLSGKMNRSMGREIPDTTFHTIQPLSIVNSKNEELTFLGNDTSVSVVHLFYSKDGASSIHLLDYLSGIAKRFVNNPVVQLYSISVDPNDSAQILNSFDQRYGSSINPNWHIVSSPNEDVLTYAQTELLIDALRDDTQPSQFIIASKFVLIDSKHRIRGFYDVNLHSEIKRLEDEIKLQLVEEIRNKPVKVLQK